MKIMFISYNKARKLLICIVNFYLFAKYLSILHARCIKKVKNF